MMKSSSPSSVARELVQPEIPADESEAAKETSPLETSLPGPIPGVSRQDAKDPFEPYSAPTNFVTVPGKPARKFSWSVGEFSAELQRELEAKGLRTPLLQSVNSSQYLGSDEPPQCGSQQVVKTRRSLKWVLKDCWRSYRSCSFTVSESMAIILLYVFLMFFATHAIFMGFHNLEKCPWKRDLPQIYAALGVTSLVALITRTYHLVQKRFFPRIVIYIDKLLFSGTVVLFVILFSLQCLTYYAMGTEPTEEGATSCDRYFYNYMVVANYVIPIVFFGMAISHGPTSFWVSTRHPCIEHHLE